MPRAPHASPRLDAVGASVYGDLARKLATFRGEVYPLHVGDTWMAPPVRIEDVDASRFPGLNRYTPPQGLPALLDALAARLTRRHGVPTAPADVLVAAGATGSLGAAVGAIVDPGDEVLILAPFWPLIAGIVQSMHGVAVPVDVLDVVDPTALVARLDAARTGRTVAVYVNTPNNPTGRVLSRDALDAVVAFARQHDLWILGDDVYEDHQYVGEHVAIRALAPERTLSNHSFSKAMGMAGNRVGYVAGPSSVMGALRKVGVHTFYSTPTASQVVALQSLEGPGDAFVAASRAAYRAAGEAASSRLGVPAPDGGTFLFVDVARALDARGLGGFLSDAADRGLFVAPGPSFGPYPTHIRACFTAAPPDVTARGFEVLATLLGR
jgi:aspartate/methionine/tyrosine aminotransferase